MRLIRWLLSLPVFVAVIVFVLQNRMQVAISFWPFDAELTMPVSVLSLGLLLTGFLMGSFVTSFVTFGAMREARKYKREAALLTEKLAAQPTATVAVPATFVGGTYKTVAPVPPRPVQKATFLQKLLRKKGPVR